MKKTMLFILLVISTIHTYAQVSVEASIDSIEMMIGQQVEVTVRATAKEGQHVNFPTYKPQQMLTPGVEIISQSDSATTDADNGYKIYTRKYRITSFDGKLYYLPPFQVKVGGQAYKSKSLALKVIEMPVDTTHADKFYGPKDVQDNPFSWTEWSLVFWLSFLMVVLLVVAYYLNIRLHDNKPIIVSMRLVKKLLPHQKAMKEIEQIKAEKMVTSENAKEYYTKLTDTLRKYIQERYGFRAMEMTSSEIIDRLTSTQDQEALDELSQLFRTADLVKFAKYTTLINENDMNLVSAIEFINKTKQENQPEQVPAKPQLTEAEVRTVKTRRSIKLAITSIIIVSMAILGYVAYTVCTMVD